MNESNPPINTSPLKNIVLKKNSADIGISNRQDVEHRAHVLQRMHTQMEHLNSVNPGTLYPYQRSVGIMVNVDNELNLINA